MSEGGRMACTLGAVRFVEGFKRDGIQDRLRPPCYRLDSCACACVPDPRLRIQF